MIHQKVLLVWVLLASLSASSGVEAYKKAKAQKKANIMSHNNAAQINSVRTPEVGAYFDTEPISMRSNQPLSNQSCSTPIWTGIFTDGFESGFGNFIDGGTKNAEIDGKKSHTGFKSLVLKDGTETSLSETSFFPVSAYSNLKVEFWYMSSRFHLNSDSFSLEYLTEDTGADWVIQETWTRGSNGLPANKIWNSVSVDFLIDTTTLRIRFVSHADSKKEKVFIDDVTVSGLIKPVNCDGGTTPCLDVIDSTIGDGSCLGDHVCRQMVETTVCDGSCLDGVQACCYAKKISIGHNSCKSAYACIESTNSTIGSNSCLGVSACDSISDVTIGSGSCLGDQACLFMGVNVGDRSCTYPGSCSCAAYKWGKDIPDDTCNKFGDCCTAVMPSSTPSSQPSNEPSASVQPSDAPSSKPSSQPRNEPSASVQPSDAPSAAPSNKPTISEPTPIHKPVNCQEGTTPCLDVSNSTIGDGSCNGNHVCRQMVRSTVGDGSCLDGTQACCYAKKTSIGHNSCKSAYACLSSSNSTIGSDSCLGVSACDSIRDRTIGSGSCLGDQACLFMGVNVGDRSCTYPGSCSCAAYKWGNHIPDDTCNIVGDCC